jgi:hypothetical protein
MIAGAKQIIESIRLTSLLRREEAWRGMCLNLAYARIDVFGQY